MDGIKIEVTGNVARVIERPARITAGTVGLPVEFSFDSQWDGLDKTAVFQAGHLCKISYGLKTEAIVPWEVLEMPGPWLSIGVYGVNEDGSVAIPTIWANVCAISISAHPDGDPSADPTLPIYQQLLNFAGDPADLKTNAKHDMVEAINEIYDKTDVASSGIIVSDREPTAAPALWFNADSMAELDKEGQLTYIDENGNKHLLHPKTKIGCVDGLEEVLDGMVSSHATDKNNPHGVTAEQVGATPASHATNKSNPHGVTAAQVGARPVDWTPTAEEVGARPDDWMPTAEEVGARPSNWMPTVEEVGARPDDWMPAAADVGAAPAGYGLGEYLYTGNAKIVDNFDNAVMTGWYSYFKGGTTINGIPANGGALEVMAYSAGRIRQIYYPYGSLAVFHRYCYDGVWANWETGVTPTNHGYHVPTPEAANAAKFLRSDNTWQTITPDNLGLQSFSTSYVNIPAKSTVRVQIPGVHFFYGRLAGATTTNAVYCITGYATIRAPLITEISAGTHLSVKSGGDNTNGWYIDFMNTSETTPYLLFCIGTQAPIMQ